MKVEVVLKLTTGSEDFFFVGIEHYNSPPDIQHVLSFPQIRCKKAIVVSVHHRMEERGGRILRIPVILCHGTQQEGFLTSQLMNMERSGYKRHFEDPTGHWST